MYSYVTARIKPEDDYDWFIFTGSKAVDLIYRGKPVSIRKGDKFGVRKSSSQKEIRLVMDNDVSRVITLTLPQAQKLAKQVQHA